MKHISKPPHPLLPLFEDKEFLKKVEKLSQIEFKERGLVNNLTPYDPNRKDEKMIEITKLYGEILNQISEYNDKQIMHEENPDLIGQEGKDEVKRQKFVSYFDQPVVLSFESGKIHEEELKRMLFLNNENPIKYNLAEFCSYFSLTPEDMRAVLRSVSYPLVGLNND